MGGRERKTVSKNKSPETEARVKGSDFRGMMVILVLNVWDLTRCPGGKEQQAVGNVGWRDWRESRAKYRDM